jgi:hypothetical protein
MLLQGSHHKPHHRHMKIGHRENLNHKSKAVSKVNPTLVLAADHKATQTRPVADTADKIFL